MINEFEEYLEAKEALTLAKRKEMKLRKAIFNKHHGSTDAEATKCEQVIDGYLVKTATTAALTVLDQELLADLVEELEGGVLTDEEMAAFTIIPKTTLAKMLKLPDDASVWQYYYLKPSDTPTVSVAVAE